MAWIYLVASEELPSPLQNGSNPPHIVKTTDTLKEYFCPECQRVNCLMLQSGTMSGGRWYPEPTVGRVANGVSNRMDKLKCLGNSVVPGQVKEAFMRLIGLK